MPVLRSTALIDAPVRTVAGLLRDAQLGAAALGRDGHRLIAHVRLLAPGDEIRVDVRMLPGVRRSMRLVVAAVSETGLTLSMVSGPLPELVHSVTLAATAAGTLVLDELSWTSPLGRLGRVLDVALLRRLVLRWQAARMDEVAARTAALDGAPVVVGTALLRDGRLLVAQRTRPADLAGRWELPGGRVEPGESEAEAVRRECQEELAVPVTVLGRLDTDLPIDAGVLRIYLAELMPGAPEPRPVEHAAVRWVGPTELPGLDWLDADRAVVANLLELLTSPEPSRPDI